MTDQTALDWYRDLTSDTEFLTEDVKLGFALCLERRMQQGEVSKAELSRRLGTSQAYITKILRGDSNLTIKSMVELATAVDGSLHLHIAPSRAEVRWLEVIQGQAGSEMQDTAANIWAAQSKRPNVNAYLAA